MLEAIAVAPAIAPTPLTRKRKRTTSHALLPTPQPTHPYLSGNFKPIHTTVPLTPCTFTGRIPEELADGQYVRNGGNPVANGEAGRDAHWFDGDGVLAGVLFRRVKGDVGGKGGGEIVPEFVNAFILTDLYLSTLASPRLKIPILPSIATLVNPLASAFYVFARILRTLLLVLLSWLPGSRQRIKRISVANTHIVFHDGRALATCESGPPMRIQLPELETVGWFNGAWSEGEKSAAQLETERRNSGKKQDEVKREKVLGQDGGVMAFMREWTTAHPKIDPITKEMVMFHSCFVPPYIQYSVLPQQHPSNATATQPNPQHQKILNTPIPGITSAKMMHDFGVSLTHTVIMDLPLSLDPMNQLTGKPTVAYDASKPSRFGVFPRRKPEEVRWFETDGCCIFHTANTWNDVTNEGVESVSMLACRLTSATLVFAAGNIAAPVGKKVREPVQARNRRRMPFFSKYDQGDEATVYERAPLLESPSSDADDDDEEKAESLRLQPVSSSSSSSSSTNSGLSDEEQCRLYYYSFSLSPTSSNSNSNTITHQWALSTLPFEFPSVRPDREMQDARYIYGCSTTSTTFGAALGKATKIDVLLKVDARKLVERGIERPPRSVTGAVDTRSMAEVLGSRDEEDVIQAFRLPEGWFAQEPRFIAAASNESEDDGWLVFYAFDEAQLTEEGDVPEDAKSEMWVLSARDMKTVVARVHLPQRVPYGLHGSWFSAEMIGSQREVAQVRSTGVVLVTGGHDGKGVVGRLWMGVRGWVEGFLG